MSDMKFEIREMVNLTSHPVCFWHPERGKVCISPSGRKARLDTQDEHMGSLTYMGCSLEIVYRRPTKVIGLPPPQTGVGYIVSRIVLENCPDRTDLFSPDVLTAERDENNNVTAVSRLLAKPEGGDDTRWR